MSKKVYISILIFTLAWNILIFLAPFLIDRGGVCTLVSGTIYRFFYTVCHQEDVRSFHIMGYKLAVCSRCVSVYLSFLVGCILYPVFKKIDNKHLPSLWYLVFPLAILILDAGLDMLDIIKNTFLTRSITGALIGFVLPFFLIPGFVNFFSEIDSFVKDKKKLKNKV